MQTSDNGGARNKGQDKHSSGRVGTGAGSETGKVGTGGEERHWGKGMVSVVTETVKMCQVPGVGGGRQSPSTESTGNREKRPTQEWTLSETSPCGLVAASPGGRDTCVVFINIYLLWQLFSSQETLFSPNSQGLTMNINIRLQQTRGASQKASADFLVSV